MNYLDHLDKSALPGIIIVVNPDVTRIIVFLIAILPFYLAMELPAVVGIKRHKLSWRLIDSYVDSNPKAWPVVTSLIGDILLSKVHEYRNFSIKTTTNELNFLSKHNGINLSEVYLLGIKKT